MAIMTVVAIVLGLTCAAVEFYVTIAGNKTTLHRVAHWFAGLAFLGLAWVIWMLK